MPKRILGIVKEEGKGEDRRAKKILTTHDVVTPERQSDAAKSAKVITTRDVRKK